jgi:arsenate reductase-like glutaredoxin family protein
MINVNIGHLKRGNLKPNTETTKVKGNKLLPQEINVTFEISEDKQLNEYLISKSKELIGIQANARLELGKIFQEVHDKLSGNKHTGLYVKWLAINGYNKMTALRHRNRYELYMEMKSTNGRTLVATVPQRSVDAVLSHKDRVSIIDLLNGSMTKDELLSILENKTAIDIVEPIDFDVETEFNNFKDTYNKININKLSNKQQTELKKLLDKFNKLFQNLD